MSILQVIQSLSLNLQRRDDFVCAARVNGAAGFGEDRREFGEVVAPFGGVKAGRFQLSKLAAQQNHSQAMAKHDAFLLRQFAGADVAIEIASKTQKVANAPDAANIDV